MTVKELIEKLKDIKPSSTDVVINNYGAYFDIKEVKICGDKVVIESFD